MGPRVSIGIVALAVLDWRRAYEAGELPQPFKVAALCTRSYQPCAQTAQRCVVTPGDLVDPNRNGVRLRTEAEVAPNEHQGGADKEPQEQERLRQPT